MKERPILFSSEMIRAILEGRKSQTRRVVKFPAAMLDDGAAPEFYQGYGDWGAAGVGHRFYVAGTGNKNLACPFGVVGDLLWVRETWAADFYWPMPGGGVRRWWEDMPPSFRGVKADPFTYYRADDSVYGFSDDGILAPCPIADDAADRVSQAGSRWHASIHMPRWASRITLEITDVSLERLQDITREDAISEGCPGWASRDFESSQFDDGQYPEEVFRDRWNARNGKRGYGWDANPWVWVIQFVKLVQEYAEATR